jgi:hypothetical protein
MLRKLNFTERAKVPRSGFSVALRRDPGGALAFDPSLSFDGIGVPSDARVYIEAYYGTSFMRFDCGTVAALNIPADRRLTEIDSSSIRFRLKIVEPASDHRILAVADDIRVTERAPGAGSRAPLLPVQFSEGLGEQAWRIAFEPDSAVLELNSRIAGIEKMAKDDPLFFALVYPAAVREILTRILLVERYSAVERSDEWWSLWIQWASHYSSAPLPTDEDEAQRWIEEVVGAFCEEHRVVERANARGGDPR